MSSPTADVEKLRRIIEVARGDRRADFVVKNAQIVDLVNEEIFEGDIAVAEGFIAGTGSYSGVEECEASNLVAVPGLIDAHTHIEMSMLTVSEFARLVVPRGTTGVVADPHEIANVLGKDGVMLMLEEARSTPLRFYCMVPSCVPSSPLETSGARIGVEEIRELLEEEEVLGLAEMMNFPGVVSADREVLEKIVLAGIVDGHAPGLRGKKLNAYIAAGASSDHETTSFEEGKEKLRLGMWVMIREGSAARNLVALKGLTGNRHTMLVTDGDRSVKDIIEEGYLDHVFRRAIEEGIDEIKALQMLTLNPAEYFGINAGLIAPSRLADIVLLKNLRKFEVRDVFVGGRRPEFKRFNHPEWAKKTVKARKITPESIQLKTGRVRVIEVYDGEIVTGEAIEEVQGVDVERDILKAVVVERHIRSGRVGKAYVRGFGLKRGAIAQSIAHDAHNIVCVGVDDGSICAAVNRVIELQGGIVVADAEVRAELPLPIAGIMSDERAERVLERLSEIEEEVRKLGCRLKSPVITLSFIALPVIPKLKLTDLGLVDVEAFRVVDLQAD
ncbi:MAG: Adenine deaminase [Archaeoglobus fulgidus]|uniref:Adenine deaminase n=1 Tax=Archaeoglobus fulgidus TaxID=2234 RepID=A0A101E1Z6_ARCFL|nr:adenine deaminase [Archaeoglobus fulgidus]KUJ94523.1 MAG: Adenine deaminase [Archaeoglobus fulgidus]KUK07625.1 MAG: Adenine deaminase [Archaeoglobus fulgidus]